MKKLTSIIAIAFLMTLGFNAVAQNTANDNATASARVMTPLAIETQRNLDFGTFTSSSTAGTVIIAPDATGSRSLTGGITLSFLNEGASAEYKVNGEKGATYSIILPSEVTINNGGTGNNNEMTIDNFKSSHTNNIGTLNSTTGQETIYVGATINVKTSQTSGDYSGNYTVTVAYN